MILQEPSSTIPVSNPSKADTNLWRGLKAKHSSNLSAFRASFCNQKTRGFRHWKGASAFVVLGYTYAIFPSDQCNQCKVRGTLPVTSGLTPGKPICFWPFIRGPCPSVYNDGAHLVGLVSVYLYNDVAPGILLGSSPIRGSPKVPQNRWFSRS